MATRFSGKGILSGLAALTSGVVNSFTLLASRLIGYTLVTGGGSSYYTTTQGVNALGFSIVTPTFPDAGHSALYTTDGISWSTGSIFSDRWGHFTQPVYNDGLWQAVGVNYGPFIHSTDGVNWNLPNAYIGNMGDVNYSPAYINLNGVKHYAAIGALGKILTSRSNGGGDGKDFTTNTIVGDSSDNWINRMVAFENMVGDKSFVTISQTGKTVYSQENAGNYSFYLGEDLSSTSTSWVDIANVTNAYGSEMIFAISSDGYVTTTTLTTSWAEPVYVGNYTLEKIYTAGTKVFITTSNGNLFVSDASDNGQNWTLATFNVANTEPIRAQIYKIWTNEYILLNQLGYIYRSFGDATAWNQGNTAAIPANVASYGLWRNLTYGDEKLIAISTIGDVVVSVEGSYGGLWEKTAEIVVEFDWKTPSAGFGQINTLQEIQVSIGNQGEEGAEILAPIDVYTVPLTKTSVVDNVTVKNNSANTITYDLGVLDERVELSDANAWKNDQTILAGQTVTVTGSQLEILEPGQRITVLPSAVDVVEVKVYGTETNTYFTTSMQELSNNSGIAFEFSNYGTTTYIRFYGSQEALQSLFSGVDLSNLSSTQTVNKKLKISGFGPIGGDQSSTVTVDSYDLGYGSNPFGGYTLALTPNWNGANPYQSLSFDATGAGNFPNGFIASY